MRRPAKRLLMTLATAAMWYGGTQMSATSSSLAASNSVIPST